MPALTPTMRSGLEGGDPLELEAVAEGQHLGLGVAELVLGPRPGGEGELAVPAR